MWAPRPATAMLRRVRRLTFIVGASIIGGAAIVAEAADDAAAECEQPVPIQILRNETITRVLDPPETFPDRLVVDEGALHDETYTFETEIPDALARSQPAFRVDARLRTGEGSLVQDAIASSATAYDSESIDLYLCVDPSPHGEDLQSGEYSLAIKFDDPRIPKTTVTVDVIVGNPSPTATAVTIGFFTLLLAGTFPLIVVVGSLNAERSVKAELWSARWLLATVICVALAGYAVATWRFVESDSYVTWRPGTANGLLDFGKHGSRGAAAALGFVGGVFALVPKFRESLGKTVTAPAPADATTPRERAAPTRAPARRSVPPAGPDRTRRRWSRWLVPVAAVVLLAGAVLVGLFASRDGGPGSGSATVASTSTVTPASNVPEGPNTLPAVADGSASDVLAGAVVGQSDGAEIAARLRDAGFNVAAYTVCSDSITTAGALRQVREARTERELLGRDGISATADDVLAPAAVEVLLASGEACGN